MAIIKYSPLLDQIRGNLNGTVFNQFRNGFSAARRGIPVRWGSATQLTRRRELAYHSQRWAKLTPGQQANWQYVAANTTVKNRLGENIHLTGHAYFVKFALFWSYMEYSDLSTINTTLNPPYQYRPYNPILEATIDQKGFLISRARISIEIIQTSVEINDDLIYVSQPVQGPDADYFGTWYYIGRTITSGARPPGNTLGRQILDTRPPKAWRTYPGAWHLIQVRNVTRDSAQEARPATIAVQIDFTQPITARGALFMNAISNQITIPYNSNLDFTGKSWTITAWIYSPQQASTWDSFLTNYNGVDNTGQHLALTLGINSIASRTNVRTGNSTDWAFSMSGDAIAAFKTGAWQFRAWRYNAATGTFGILNSWINEDPLFPTGYTPWSENQPGTDLDDYDYSNKVWAFNAGLSSFSGTRQEKYISSIAFFDRTLSTSEVVQIYRGKLGFLPIAIPNLQGFYELDQPPGTAIASAAESPGSPESLLIIDQSVNSNNAFATGYQVGQPDFVDANI